MLTKEQREKIDAIDKRDDLNLQQKADAMTEVFIATGSPYRVVVAVGKVPRLRFIAQSRRESSASPDTSVSG